MFFSLEARQNSIYIFQHAGSTFDLHAQYHAHDQLRGRRRLTQEGYHGVQQTARILQDGTDSTKKPKPNQEITAGWNRLDPTRTA